MSRHRYHCGIGVEAIFLFFLVFASVAYAQEFTPTSAPPDVYGPWNAEILPDGLGVAAELDATDALLHAEASWTLVAWVNTTDATHATELIAGMGTPNEEYPRYLALTTGKAMLYLGERNTLSGGAQIRPGTWHLLAASFDGVEFRLYEDGEQVAEATFRSVGATGAAAGTRLLLGSVSPAVEIGPTPEPPYFTGTRPTGMPEFQHFGGKVYGLQIFRHALSPVALRSMEQSHPDFDLPVYEAGSQPWAVQTSGQAGYSGPQAPDQMPRSRAPFETPKAVPPANEPIISEEGDGLWQISGGWRMIPAQHLKAEGGQISQRGFSTQGWYAAAVPGTVLTTLVERGVYPNPYFGLNNLAIPETLNKQSYWYRTEFTAPATGRDKWILTFEGINYKAEVWLNGRRLGEIKGAFLRGTFDVTGTLQRGKTNVLAVEVSPPPHPGVPQEQSIKGGPGANGGMMCLDGPTFVATEGWDWIPAIRDRDTGIWQPIMLRATNSLKIGDPQVVTTLPLPSTSSADVDIVVPISNGEDRAVHARLTAAFEGVTVKKEVYLQPGANAVKLTAAEFSQLEVRNPRLWWPNGYGPANLYHLRLTVAVGGQVSDMEKLRFGIREISYELSLLDPTGHLVRDEFSPTTAYEAGQTGMLIGDTHGEIRDIPAADPLPADEPASWKAGWHSWVQSLTSAGAHSPAISPSSDEGTAPYLVLKVNGVRIAARGGNWGMDDAMKNVSRAHLEPYFRLHHDAGENIIRNWVGQSTEETFYELADEYGFLVWNDFWESTENYNIEAEDPALFLQNARDVILRFRNHPSIVVWCGRNEGVPQPIINQGLDDLIRTLDGTRYYSPSSNAVNLQGSGPYKYQDPRLYYTTLNHGFSVETGTPSMSTLESFEAWTAKPDWWPMDDVWAYHDWHFRGNGDTHPFMAEMETEFGAPTSLEDFERKAQMLDYVNYRAIFEGMNAHLWRPNSGRLLWMTQPAWPSNMWEVLSYDYDTQSSYFGEKKALQPVHIQLDLATDAVDVVNTTRSAKASLLAVADIYSLTNQLLLHQERLLRVEADSETSAMGLNLTSVDKDAVVLVELKLKDASGHVVSSNLYWVGGDDRDLRQLTLLPDAVISSTAALSRQGKWIRVTVRLKNTGSDVALQNKLTLLDSATGKRILPAFYTDNYVSLLPGESESVEVEYAADTADGRAPTLTLRGFNLPQRSIAITTQ